jgi:CDP-diacylglycerol---serine O-phosphatidyltransferase
MTNESVIKKNIPNVITLCNVFLGSCGLVAVLYSRIDWAIWLIFAAGICDFADGLVARWLGVHSELGKQLDSLADMISFGLVPGAVMFKMLHIGTNNYAISSIGFLITVFSALRLAIFNLDTRQSDTFIGLATPASTMLVMGTWMWVDYYFCYWYVQYMLLIMTVCVAALLILPIPMFSNKFKGSGFKGNELRYIFLGIIACALVGFGYFNLASLAFAPVMLLYLLISFAQFFLAKFKK